MEKPKIENLKAWITGRDLNIYQKADAVIEFNKLLDYVEELEQCTISGVSKSFYCDNTEEEGMLSCGEQCDFCKEHH